MKLDQLVYFIQAAKHESVIKAARAIGISPSAISSSVAALERELGKQLFLRERQRIFLTAHGKVLMVRATRLLDEMENLKADLSSDQLPYEGHYRIGCTRILAAHAVGSEWAKYQALHTKLSVEFRTFQSIDVVAKAATGEIDVGICLDPVSHPEAESKRIGSDRYEVAFRTGHPLAEVDPRELAERLKEFPACMPRATSGLDGYQVIPILEKSHVRPHVDFIYDSFDPVFHRLLNSDAWTLMPTFLSKKHGKELRFVNPPDWNVRITIAAVWPRRRPLSAALAEFLEVLTRRFKVTG